MNSSRHLNTVIRGSRILAPLSLIAALIWPLVEVGWMLWTPAPDLCREFSIHLTTGGSVILKLWQRVALATLAAVPALAASMGLWALHRCFRFFTTGEFFSVQTIQSLRRCAGWTFCSVALEFITHPMATGVLTANFPSGEHEILFSVGSHAFQTLLVAGTVWVISGAMAEAGRLADENAQFV
ncbi:MAG: DUF2975 domain-containing protein [Geothrix sp.]|uniref:DUF2975 domain-containing protein n=1 Tax=Geothrix sp. TaxID=1962974 RepID=UPI0017CADA2E|nr:DUF2975 domain-containing protein [Geothrix sp.]NWJ39355.1 DUF2975 domain-containing protein [Geothrix sp.]WIL19420.1 MAG: DUF2975 domain-containing protein [Geothrix sp.]